MARKRMVLEIGMGNDLHGGDYTKAAIRAVEDAIHHSSLTLIQSLDIARKDMHVDVKVGVQEPDSVDTGRVAETLPYGQVTVTAVPGGLDVPNDAGDDKAVIATAGIVVRVDLPE